MPATPNDPAAERTRRIEESLGFLEHTVDALSKQYADLQADLARAERRLRVLEQREADRSRPKRAEDTHPPAAADASDPDVF